MRESTTNSINIDPRIISKEMEIEERIDDAIKNNRYSAFCFDTFRKPLYTFKSQNDYEKYEMFYEMILEYDQRCKLPYEVGNMINSVMKDPNYTAAIHRTYIGNIEYVDGMPTNSILSSIMSDGLINNGHLSSGGYTDDPSLALATSSLSGIGDLANLFFSYKNNNVTILFRFPEKLVNKDLDFRDAFASSEIYERKNEKYYIKPEYILGVIVKEDQQDKFYSREQLLSVKRKEMN